MREPDTRIQVRLSKTTAESVEAAATAEGIPTSTWIRNQIMASLYLGGVKSAPQVIYQGFRYSIQDIADNLDEVLLASRALPELMENLMTVSMISGGLDPVRSAEQAQQFVQEALANSSWQEEEGDEV